MSDRNSRALVIVDELGRGTSPTDGVSIAWAVSEALMQKDAFVFFVTHFEQLTNLQDIYSNVRNSHMAAAPATAGSARLKFEFTVRQGPCTETAYGLAAAEVSGMPRGMLDVARKVSAELAANKKARDAERAERRESAAEESSLVLELVKKLRSLQGTALAKDEVALRGHLRSLQEEHTEMDVVEQ